VLWLAFFLLQFGFVTFCQKNIGEKRCQENVDKIDYWNPFYQHLKGSFGGSFKSKTLLFAKKKHNKVLVLKKAKKLM